MGCWNDTCAISNLHVGYGADVVVLMLLENRERKEFVYSNALYDVCPIPFYGKYDDYGGVDDCHGYGLNIVVEAIKSRLYEFGQGPNSLHDCVVNKSIFDVSLMFEADQKGRLGIEEAGRFNGDEYDLRALRGMDKKEELTPSQLFELDRLANKLKKVDSFRQVTHVVIRKDVVDGIMENWYYEEYVGKEEGNKGYNNSYKHIYFKDVIASIPEYINRVKVDHEESKSKGKISRLYGRKLFLYNDSCYAGVYMESFNRDSTMSFGLVYMSELINGLIDNEKWDELAVLAKEALTVYWLNMFMSHSRKLWSKQTTSGGQSSDGLPYEVLSNVILKVLAEERKEYGDDDENVMDEDDIDVDEFTSG